ncbi:protein of unknown function [Kyrpidia spormannii]|uniref:Uncharacterized protein n=1 Tax=Kyrpidia spormannii TaxID=2055160 RepID=A0ACA8Z4R4_9BACL|nr:protein of unknown function [Kyrpidia spormannii]
MQLPGVTVEVHKLEAAPLVAYLCRELRVAEIIDAHVTWDRHRTEVSPGTAITALLVNLLVRREPLYQIEWFFRDMDVEALFGNGIEAGHFNDDRLARALDKFADADPWRIYHEIALGSPDACSLVLMSFGWTPPPFPSKAATIPPTSRMRLFGSPEDTARTCVRTSSSFSLGWGVTAVFPYSLM